MYRSKTDEVKKFTTECCGEIFIQEDDLHQACEFGVLLRAGGLKMKNKEIAIFKTRFPEHLKYRNKRQTFFLGADRPTSKELPRCS